MLCYKVRAHEIQEGIKGLFVPQQQQGIGIRLHPMIKLILTGYLLP